MNKSYEIPNNRMRKGFVDFLSKCLIEVPFKKITLNEIKTLKWINEKEINLTKIKSPLKIEASINEIKNSISFFKFKIKNFTDSLRKKIEGITIINMFH